MPNIITTRSQIESLGARIVRLASQERLAAPSKPRVTKRVEHEYVRNRPRALALLRDHVEMRGELARQLGHAAGAVVGFRVFKAEQAPLPRAGVRIGGGGEWTETARASDVVERPTKRRGRPGRRGKLVAALARSRMP